MSRQLFISFYGEGTTDYRFLMPIIKRTVDDVIFECCDFDVDVDDISEVKISKTGESFPEYVVDATKKALENGSQLLIVHTDSDKETYEERYQNKFIPAYEALRNNGSTEIKDFEEDLIPIIPIRMIEAWMLADIDLLKSEIGTKLSNADLKLTGNPESTADPKAKISEAIRLAKEEESYKQKVSVKNIGSLYESIGSKISLDKLKRLSAYNKFLIELKRGLKKIGYLH